MGLLGGSGAEDCRGLAWWVVGYGFWIWVDLGVTKLGIDLGWSGRGLEILDLGSVEIKDCGGNVGLGQWSDHGRGTSQWWWERLVLAIGVLGWSDWSRWRWWQILRMKKKKGFVVMVVAVWWWLGWCVEVVWLKGQLLCRWVYWVFSMVLDHWLRERERERKGDRNERENEIYFIV